MNLSKKEITTLVKAGKLLKSETIVIHGSRIIDVNNNIILTYIDLPFTLTTEILSYRLQDLATLESIMNKDSIVFLDNLGNIYINNNIVVFNIYRNDITMYSFLMNINNMRNSIPMITINNIRDNEFFEHCITSTTNVLFNVKDRYIITLFKGLLPINKSDKVTLNIYNSDEYSFICHFAIDKKSFIHNMYMRYIYLV